VLRIELTRAAADPSRQTTDRVGDREPDRGDTAEDRVEEARDRTPSAAYRARGGTALRG
jgi:hypothetical protein